MEWIAFSALSKLTKITAHGWVLYIIHNRTVNVKSRGGKRENAVGRWALMRMVNRPFYSCAQKPDHAIKEFLKLIQLKANQAILIFTNTSFSLDAKSRYYLRSFPQKSLRVSPASWWPCWEALNINDYLIEQRCHVLVTITDYPCGMRTVAKDMPLSTVPSRRIGSMVMALLTESSLSSFLLNSESNPC